MEESDGRWESYNTTTILGPTYGSTQIWQTTMSTSDWEGSEEDKEKQGTTFLARDESTEGNK